jgi:hypothetical protein
VIDLVKDVDYVWMVVIAAGLGAIGGLGAELLLQRADNTGTLEIPGRLRGTRFFDIGFPASLILGAIAAVAILYFFPPVVEKVIVEAGKEPRTEHEYDLVRLIALSVIVGSAGPAFLSTAQARVMSALNAQKVGTAVDTGQAQVDQVVESAKAAVPAAVQKAFAENMPGASAKEIQSVSQTATDALGLTLEPQAVVARDQIAAVGIGTRPDETRRDENR